MAAPEFPAADGCIVEDGQEISVLLDSNFPHPELRGGTRPSKHRFSPRQLTALEAICNTVIPSLPAEASTQDNLGKAKLFQLSASDAGIVPEIAGMLFAWLTKRHFFLVHIALLMLSTRLGTFLLAGFRSVTTEFPFFQPFAALELERREKILLKWSQSVIFKLQMLFKVLKCYTVYKFYSRADENGRNPAWDAIGYQIPNRLSEQQDDSLPGPLEARLVDARAPNLETKLAKLGCTMLDNIDHLRSDDYRRSSSNKVSSSREIGIKCDVVVVGSGSGGGVVAARLTKLGYKVVVVEKGDYFPRKGLSLLEGPSMNAMYEQSGALTTDDGSVILLTGTTLGGGSAINWAASLKTPEHVRQEWAKQGLDIFAGDEYVRAMEAVCRRLGVQEQCTAESFQNSVLRAGCTSLGYSVRYIPRNAGKDHHCGFCGFGCPLAGSSAGKQSVADTWLCDAAAAGAVILTACKAERVLTTATARCDAADRKMFKASGVLCRAGESFLHVEARAVVVACGSLFTPPLLYRSGLCNPHIGRNLSVHPVAVVWGHFPQEDILPGTPYEGGIMTSLCDVASNWASTGYGSILETPSVHPGTFAVLTPWRSGFDSKRRMLNYRRTASIIILNRDRGRGTVCEEPGTGKLIVDYPLLSSDKKSLIEGTKAALRLLAAAGAESIGTDCASGEIFSVPGHSPAELEAFLERVTSGMFRGLSTPILSAHQMGTCRMGPDPRSSAVDPNCETWEVEGLFVGDSSVFPTASGVNPMITVQSVAYCTADSVARSLKNVP